MTGVAAEILGADMTSAEYAVAEAATMAEGSVVYMINALAAAGAIQIDASGKVSAIGSIQSAAAAAGMTVAEFAAALAAINGASFQLNMNPDGSGGVVSANVKPITWSGGGSTRRSGGGGGRSGGGGGGSSTAKVSESIEKLIKGMTEALDIKDYRRELAQLAQSYYEARGELQGVILYLNEEKKIVEENTETIKGYLGTLEDQIAAKKAELSATKEGSKQYEQIKLDLAKLEETHQKYSKQLIKNRTDVINLTKSVKEQQDKIRDMEIDLRNTLLKAIEDREAREKRMLEGRIDMENTILDLIKKRYEKERDEILETQNAKKDALNEEKNQIDELLEARRKLADQEDKMQEIAELEAKIARISADPTRQKEAMQLREELAQKREDMAWEAAEAEAEAQKDSIQQQIDSIDDYIDYVKEYYEDLFAHPQKLIEEMQGIISKTDEEIIEWLKANDESFAESTESTQQKMIESWQETLDNMRGAITTYWDEVEEIIAKGEDGIISFLKEHTEEYQKAGKEQAEKYVDEWLKKLEDLRLAHKKVTGSIEDFDPLAGSASSGGGSSSGTSSGGGGGGGGGGSGSGSGYSYAAAPAVEQKTKYRYEWKDRDGEWHKAAEANTEELALERAQNLASANWKYVESEARKKASLRGIENASPLYVRVMDGYPKKYSLGGMNTTTGLAWLDGTPQRPERILSPIQTELFEDLVKTLQQIRTVRLSAPSITPMSQSANVLPNIDSIVVNVATLSKDADYEEAAEKMMNGFYRKIARGRPVGGIQAW